LHAVFEKSVLVPLNADETFALITQPDRLRPLAGRHPPASTLRAGGGLPGGPFLFPGTRRAGTFTEVEPGPPRRLHLGLGGLDEPTPFRNRDHHAGARRGRDHGPPHPRRG